MRRFVEVLKVRERAAAGERLHPPHTRGERSIGDDLEDADVAGAVDVASAAEFARPVAGGDDAHHVAVFFAEHRYGAALLRIGDGHDCLRDFDVLANLLIHDVFDRFQLLVRERLVIRVVEAQAVGRDE